ncbi:MAG: hypothetical protein R2857_10165 [Vampirovibrionales bacterium]
MTSTAGLARSQQYIGQYIDLGLSNDADILNQKARMAQTSVFQSQLAEQDTMENLQSALQNVRA